MIPVSSMIYRAVKCGSRINTSNLHVTFLQSLRFAATTTVVLPLQCSNDVSKRNSIATFLNNTYQEQYTLVSTRVSSPMNIRWYNSTLIVTFPIRRRRPQNIGLSGGDDDDGNESTNAIGGTTSNHKSDNVAIEPDVFLSHVTKLYDTVHQAMIPLIPINEIMIITRGESSREMHEEEDRLEKEEKKRMRKEMKDKQKEAAATDAETTSGATNMNRNDNDNEREPISVQSLGDHRIMDGPYLKIELGPIHGQYTFVADVELSRVLFQSPISGQLIYYYDIQNTNEWINLHDQHNLLGMFVRDIIRQIHGVPKI